MQERRLGRLIAHNYKYFVPKVYIWPNEVTMQVKNTSVPTIICKIKKVKARAHTLTVCNLAFTFLICRS